MLFVARIAGAACLCLAGAASAQAGRLFEGTWGTDAAACRDLESADRLSVEGRRFFWYETRCSASAIRAAGPHAWAMRMACTGEGARFSATPRVSLPSRNVMVMEHGPVGPDPTRQTYVRCR